jgi:hypothetical protein
VFWDAAHQHHIRHSFQNTQAVDPPGNPDCQTLPGELVDQRHQPDFAAIIGQFNSLLGSAISSAAGK